MSGGWHFQTNACHLSLDMAAGGRHRRSRNLLRGQPSCCHSLKCQRGEAGARPDPVAERRPHSIRHNLAFAGVVPLVCVVPVPRITRGRAHDQAASCQRSHDTPRAHVHSAARARPSALTETQRRAHTELETRREHSQCARALARGVRVRSPILSDLQARARTPAKPAKPVALVHSHQ